MAVLTGPHDQIHLGSSCPGGALRKLTIRVSSYGSIQERIQMGIITRLLASTIAPICVKLAFVPGVLSRLSEV